MDEKVLVKLRTFLTKLGVSQKGLERDPDVLRESLLDSMQAVDYLVMIEEAYGIDIKMKTVNEKELGRPSKMAQYIQTKMSEKTAG